MSTQDILAADMRQAVELIGALTAKPEKKRIAYEVHPTLVAQAQALVFVFHKKAGLVLGLDRGHGFAIARLATHPDGTAQWSAPSFLEATSVTLGATIGHSEAAAVSLVLSPAAKEFLVAHGTLGPALSASADLTLSQKWHTNKISLDMLIAEDVISAGLADGVLADLSAGVSSFRVAQALNEELYGAGIAPRDILTSPALPPPPQFAEIYDSLNHIIRVSKTLPPEGAWADWAPNGA